MNRIKLTHGSARVDDNVSTETIQLLNRLVETVYQFETEGFKLQLNIDKNTCDHKWKITHGGYTRDCTRCGRKE